jgi:Arc/MetJ-type ribon-helix-helix transcriptional regulator
MRLLCSSGLPKSTLMKAGAQRRDDDWFIPAFLGSDSLFRIPFWYHIGMSIQIAVRLPDEMVRFVDQLVESGRGSSRAAVIARALNRERRYEMAVQDAAIYAETGEDADMVDLVQHLHGHPLDPDR